MDGPFRIIELTLGKKYARQMISYHSGDNGRFIAKTRMRLGNVLEFHGKEENLAPRELENGKKRPIRTAFRYTPKLALSRKVADLHSLNTRSRTTPGRKLPNN